MDQPGNHNSQQTDTRIENQIPHVLAHRQMLNNEKTWTEGEEHHILGTIGELGEGQWEVGRVGRDNMGRSARCR